MMPAKLTSLIEQLASGNSSDQCAAAEALARLGSESRPAAAALAAALSTTDAPTRDWCVAALEDLGQPPREQIGELTTLVGENSLDTAYWAITLLGRAAGEAAPAVPALVEALQSSPHLAVRERAAWALGKIGPAAKSAVPALQAAANADEPRLARLARQAIAGIQ
jgi:HEAT repeat protein